MSYQWWQALVAGAAGVLAMLAFMRAGLAMRVTRLEVPLLLGSMFTRDPQRARRMGTTLHTVNGLLFGLTYAAVWWAIGIGAQGAVNGAWIGAAFGAVHGAVALAVLPMMGRVHPQAVEPYPAPELARRRERALVGAGAPTAGETSGVAPQEVRLPNEFGVGGSGFGRASPTGLVLAHLVYGAAWGVVFALLL